MTYTKSENIKKLKLIVERMNLIKLNEKRIEDIESTIKSTFEDGYWDWNLSDNYKYFSPSLKTQLGYRDNEIENINKALEHLILVEDIQKLLDAMSEHINSNGEKPFRVLLRYKHKKGHIIKILSRGKVIEWGEDGEPLRMVGSHVDVTDI